jgi:hypothetical protein
MEADELLRALLSGVLISLDDSQGGRHGREDRATTHAS